MVQENSKTLANWRQGDLVLGEEAFFYRDDSGQDIASSSESGLVVITQTCDIVRDPTYRPYIQVAPLVKIPSGSIKPIKRGYRPQYLYLPEVASQNLVGDLDRIMTIEKSILLNWNRTPGWVDDEEGRRISGALTRKFARPAFPDEFVGLVKDFQERLISKHDKNSKEGKALRVLQEIRVRAAPSWNHDEVDVHFLFIEEPEHDIDAEILLEEIQKWMARIKPSDRFDFTFEVSTLEDITGKDYVESDLLDLDHLSTRE